MLSLLARPSGVLRRTRLLGRATRLTRAEWRDFLRAQTALCGAQISVWVRPVGALVSDRPASGASGPQPDASPVAEAQTWSDARRLATAVRRAAEHGVFRPKCLVRSIALSRMLDRRRITGSRVCVGVQRDGERFTAHAWVELHGRVLGDVTWHVRAFTPLTEVRVV